MTSQSQHRARGATTLRHLSRNVISSGWPSSGYKISWGGDALPRSSPDRILFPAMIQIDLKAEKCDVFIKTCYRSRNTFPHFRVTHKTQVPFHYTNSSC
jgi:hypothetical protein